MTSERCPPRRGVSGDVAERGPPDTAQSMDEDPRRQPTRQIRATGSANQPCRRLSSASMTSYRSPHGWCLTVGRRSDPSRGPIPRASIAISTRLDAPSLPLTFATWTEAVFLLMNKASAISPSVRPSATRPDHLPLPRRQVVAAAARVGLPFLFADDGRPVER